MKRMYQVTLLVSRPEGAGTVTALDDYYLRAEHSTDAKARALNQARRRFKSAAVSVYNVKDLTGRMG